jgi:hypothetical protein
MMCLETGAGYKGKKHSLPHHTPVPSVWPNPEITKPGKGVCFNAGLGCADKETDLYFKNRKQHKFLKKMTVFYTMSVFAYTVQHLVI